MRIQKIIIHNFRSIEYQELILENYSIFFGENNSGKSNFVNALRFFFREIRSFEYDYIRRRSQWAHEVKVDVYFLLNEKDEQKVDKKFIIIDGKKKF